MSVLFTTVPAKRLSRSITASDTGFVLENIEGWNGSDLSASDFGTQLYAVFRDANNTVMELMEIDPATIASATISILRRGLAFTGDRTTELTARKLDWTKNTTIVELGAVSPQDLQYLKEYIDGIALAGSPVASQTAKGLVEMATFTEIDNDDDSGSTDAPLAVLPSALRSSKYGIFIAAATGMVIPYAGNSAPTGFLLCDGTAYDNDTYPALSVILAGRYGYNTGTTVTATAASDLLNATSHGLSNGEIIFFSTSGTLPAGLSVNTPYYVISSLTNTFQVSTTSGGSAVDITDTGSGTHRFHTQFRVPDTRGRMVLGAGTGTFTKEFTATRPSTTFTTTHASELFTSAGHGLATGDIIFVSNSGGALPSNLSAGTPYIVYKIDNDTFNLYSSAKALAADLAGGTTQVYTRNRHTIGSDGTGTHSFHRTTLTLPSNLTLRTGQAVTLSNSGGALPTGYSAATTYYVIRVSATQLLLATTLLNALDKVAISITDVGTGTHSLTVTRTARTVGDEGGEESHSLTVAQLPPHYAENPISFGSSDGGDSAGTSFSESQGPTGIIGNGEPMNVMNPFVSMNHIIRY